MIWFKSVWKLRFEWLFQKLRLELLLRIALRIALKRSVKFFDFRSRDSSIHYRENSILVDSLSESRLKSVRFLIEKNDVSMINDVLS
jgi:hypothetical protein